MYTHVVICISIAIYAYIPVYACIFLWTLIDISRYVYAHIQLVWHNHPVLYTFDGNMQELANLGFAVTPLLNRSVNISLEKGLSLQAVVRNELQRHLPCQLDMEKCMTRRLVRCQLAGNPRTTARRSIRLLDLLSKKAPPCVAVGTLRCLWNGWPSQEGCGTCGASCKPAAWAARKPTTQLSIMHTAQ